MSDRTYDVIVVGGGHNGLACASYLARGGLDVIVLEQRSIPGGAAATEEPWPGYRISTASYVVSLMPEKIVTDLELRRHGYQVTVLEPDYYVPYADGTSMTLWGDAQRTHAEISKFSKADADAYVEFDKYLTHLGGLVHDLLYVIPPNLGVMDIPKWLSLGGKVRKWSGRDAAEVVRLFTVSAADFLDEWFENDRVKGALATQAIIGAWCGPMSPCSAYVLLHHWMGSVEGHEGAWGWVHGGMGAVGRTMADSATAAGAEIRLDASVKRIDIRNGTRARRRVGGWLYRVGAARHLERPSRHDVQGPGGRRAPPRRGGEGYQSLPESIGLSQGQPRAVGATEAESVGWLDAGRPPHRDHVDLAVGRIPRARVGRREVRAHVRASLRRVRIPDGLRTRSRARGETHRVVLHAVRPVRARRGFVGRRRPRRVRGGVWSRLSTMLLPISKRPSNTSRS